MILTVVPLCLLLLANSSFGHNDFSYDGPLGPSSWGKEYHTCIGKHQSPINIQEHFVQTINLPPLKFSGMDRSRASVVMNNGHTVMLKANDSISAEITGGPLGNATYVFEQLHFHWGENDLEGSEDLINNHSFAMELHAVFYKKEYETFDDALAHPDGLAVLAYFYEAVDDTNKNYMPIVEMLPYVEMVGHRDHLREPLFLEDLLEPKNLSVNNYFAYRGSLTTPPCYEVVTWIDFKDPQLLSHEQLASFRNIRKSDGEKLTHNFRPVQPLEDRIVYQNVPDPSRTPDNFNDIIKGVVTNEQSGQPSIIASMTVILAGLIFSVL